MSHCCAANPWNFFILQNWNSISIKLSLNFNMSLHIFFFMFSFVFINVKFLDQQSWGNSSLDWSNSIEVSFLLKFCLHQQQAPLPVTSGSSGLLGPSGRWRQAPTSPRRIDWALKHILGLPGSMHSHSKSLPNSGKTIPIQGVVSFETLAILIHWNNGMVFWRTVWQSIYQKLEPWAYSYPMVYWDFIIKESKNVLARIDIQDVCCNSSCINMKLAATCIYN